MVRKEKSTLTLMAPMRRQAPLAARLDPVASVDLVAMLLRSTQIWTMTRVKRMETSWMTVLMTLTTKKRAKKSKTKTWIWSTRM